jgi:hypothetical protein
MMSNIFDQRIKFFEDRVLAERGDPISKVPIYLKVVRQSFFRGFTLFRGKDGG